MRLRYGQRFFGWAEYGYNKNAILNYTKNTKF